MTDPLIVGCGYVGTRLARQYLKQGNLPEGVVAGDESRARLDAEGISVRRLDIDSDDLGVLPLNGVSLFLLAPPPAVGTKDPRTRRLVDQFQRQGGPKRVVYISTTGVYGDCRGDWVDETWPARPAVDRAHRRWDAEQVLRQWSRSSGGELVVLRVAGIYGPGRLPLKRIVQRLPLVRAEDAPWSNRIHVDDLVSACVAAMERGCDGAVYNICDGHPSTMTDYFFQVADATGLERPPVIPFAEAEGRLSAGMMSYMRESRRLSNRKMREELGVELRFPTLGEGLVNCI